MYYVFDAYKQLSAAILVYDPFNPTSLSFKPEGFALFVAGFTTSLAASLAGFAALLSLRTVKPYRPRSRSYALLLTILQILSVAVIVVGLVFYDRSFDYRVIGTLLTLLYTPFPFIFLLTESSKIWCQPLPGPKPPLAPRS